MWDVFVYYLKWVVLSVLNDLNQMLCVLDVCIICMGCGSRPCRQSCVPLWLMTLSSPPFKSICHWVPLNLASNFRVLLETFELYIMMSLSMFIPACILLYLCIKVFSLKNLANFWALLLGVNDRSHLLHRKSILEQVSCAQTPLPVYVTLADHSCACPFPYLWLCFSLTGALVVAGCPTPLCFLVICKILCLLTERTSKSSWNDCWCLIWCHHCSLDNVWRHH
jgi:hypothetical protein